MFRETNKKKQTNHIEDQVVFQNYFKAYLIKSPNSKYLYWRYIIINIDYNKSCSWYGSLRAGVRLDLDGFFPILFDHGMWFCIYVLVS